jgi:hypothetical protein
MTHCSPAELVEAFDGTLPPGRGAHLERCATCRERLAELRAAVGEAGALETPEPSPLFWDHLSARVRDAVAQEPVPAARWWADWTPRQVPVLAAACALLVLVVSAGLWRDTLRNLVQPPRPTAGSSEVAGRTGAPESAIDEADPEFDFSWSLVLSVAEEIDWEDEQVAGIGLRPGSAESAVLRLTQEERAELARLLAAELHAMGS